MKGRLLSYEQVKNLKDGDKVWVEYDRGEFPDQVNGIEHIEAGYFVDKNEIVAGMQYMLGWLKEGIIEIYEYIEDEQTITKETTSKAYKGSEILAMIEDGRFKDDDIVIDEDDIEYTFDDFKYALIKNLLTHKFIVKPKPVDFMTAVNSGKNIRPESLKNKGFKPYTYWLGNIVSNMDSNKNRTPMNPLDLINGQWEIEY